VASQDGDRTGCDRALLWHTPTTEPYEVRQVSWLAGLGCFARLPGPERPVTKIGKAARRLQLRVSSGFPSLERHRIPS
jgi:hypothetical protein